MSVLKAFLYTILLLAIQVILDFGFHLPSRTMDFNADSFTHYIQVTSTLSIVSGYFIILFFAFEFRFSLAHGFEKIKHVQGRSILLVILTLLGFKLMSRPLYDIKLMIDSTYSYFPEHYNEIVSSRQYLLGYTFFKVVLLAPILEELFFRKFLFRGLLKKHSFLTATLISSLCFSLIHIPDWLNLMPTFIFGLICCAIYNKTQSILYPIIFHFSGNLLWFISLYSRPIPANIEQQPSFNWIYWTVFLLGVGFTALGLRAIAKTNKLKT